jgi:hypothetical protein
MKRKPLPKRASPKAAIRRRDKSAIPAAIIYEAAAIMASRRERENDPRQLNFFDIIGDNRKCTVKHHPS